MAAERPGRAGPILLREFFAVWEVRSILQLPSPIPTAYRFPPGLLRNLCSCRLRVVIGIRIR